MFAQAEFAFSSGSNNSSASGNSDCSGSSTSLNNELSLFCSGHHAQLSRRGSRRRRLRQERRGGEQRSDDQQRVVVLDQTGAGIPAAAVTVTPPGNQPLKIAADERGLANLAALPVGTVQLHVESPGFLPYDAPLTLRRGLNNQTVTLKIEGFQEQVVVDETAVQASGSAETTKVLDESVIDQLPDDPDELQATLEQMAGGIGAVFRVNGFTGGRLPNREDIRQIRFRTNSFAADNHDAGRVQIDIITRPNVRTWNGNFNANFRNDALNARDAFALSKTPQNIARFGGGVRGPLVAGRTSLRLNLTRNQSDNAAEHPGHQPGRQPVRRLRLECARATPTAPSASSTG